jgi:hypothetical protein
MNGRRAKTIRRKVFGDFAYRATMYVTNPKTGAIECTGLRRQYKDAKKEWKSR